MRCQMGFETLVGRTAAECLRIWAGAVVAPPGHALLEAACSGWTAPITAIAVGVFLVARKPRHWLTRTLLLAAVIPFALLLSVLVVVMDRRGYLVSDGNGAVLLLVSAVLLTLDVLTGLLLRHRINRDQSKSVPVRTKGDTRTLCNRRSAWHWWLTVPVVLALAVFQSVLWWNPDLVLSRDPARKRAVFPHAAWEQGSLPNLQRGGQAIEVGPVEVVSGGFSSLQTYRWQIEGPQLKMWLSIDLPLTNWQSPAPAAVGWFDAPELRWLKLEMLEAGGPAVAYRSPAGGDHFYLWVMVFNERGVALPVPAVGLDSWQSELAQLVDRSLLARVVGWPEATCRLRLEFTSQRQLTTDELRRVALEFQQVARWLERTFQEQPASGRRGAE